MSGKCRSTSNTLSNEKIIAILLLVCAFLPLNQALAQRASEYNIAPRDYSWNKSGVFANIGFGLSVYDYCGYWDHERNFTTGLSVDLGYRYHFGQGFYWNIFKLSYYNPYLADFGDSSSLRFMTGARYLSQPILAERPLYAHFDLGYYLNVGDHDYYEWDGFAYEIGVGVALSRTISLGLAWEGTATSHHQYRQPIGIFALQLGINF